MEKQTVKIKSMTRQELATAYRMSTKTLARRLARLGLTLGPDRIILPAQIIKIIDAFGHWELYTDDS